MDYFCKIYALLTNTLDVAGCHFDLFILDFYVNMACWFKSFALAKYLMFLGVIEKIKGGNNYESK